MDSMSKRLFAVVGRVLLLTLEMLLPVALALWLLWPLIQSTRPPELLPPVPTAILPKAQAQPIIKEAAGCQPDKRTCKAMISCEEAKFYLEHCGKTRLDGDKDGIPCEKLCN